MATASAWHITILHASTAQVRNCLPYYLPRQARSLVRLTSNKSAASVIRLCMRRIGRINAGSLRDLPHHIHKNTKVFKPVWQKQRAVARICQKYPSNQFEANRRNNAAATLEPHKSVSITRCARPRPPMQVSGKPGHSERFLVHSHTRVLHRHKARRR